MATRAAGLRFNEERLSSVGQLGNVGSGGEKRRLNMPGLEKPLTGLQCSRRNLIRISAIVASAIIAKTTPAAADNNDKNKHHDHNDRSCL